jgi:hypothetical protein
VRVLGLDVHGPDVGLWHLLLFYFIVFLYVIVAFGQL